MKNYKKIVTSLLLALCIFKNSIVFAQSCSAWITSNVSNPFCVQEHCGIWDKTALAQRFYQYRNCVRKDGSLYRENRSFKRHIDCGC